MPVYSTIPNMELTGSKTDTTGAARFIDIGQVSDIIVTSLEWPLAKLDHPHVVT